LQDYWVAVAAYDKAAHFSDGAADPVIARAAALTGKSAVYLSDALRLEHTLAAGSRIANTGNNLDKATAKLAAIAASEALKLLAPHEVTESDDGQFTARGRALSAAFLQLALVRGAYANAAFGWPDLPELESIARVTTTDGRSHCAMYVVAAALRPDQAMETALRASKDIGGAVLRIQLDQSGALLERRLVDATPAGYFADALEEIYDEWSLEPMPGNEDGCLMAGVRYIAVYIRLPGNHERSREFVGTPFMKSVYPLTRW
jgi:hypothetical protein